MDNEKIREIIDYYEKRVSQYGTSGKATLLDDNLRSLEIETILSWLRQDAKVLDIFCGNGVTTIELSKHCDSIVGVDLSSNMIGTARELVAAQSPVPQNISFEEASVLDIAKKFGSGRFDTVVSIRGLINLPSWDLQKQAILGVHEILPPSGEFLFIEGSAEGLGRINDLRMSAGLPEIRKPWYDTYFNDTMLLDFMSEHFDISASRDLDTYFLLSRVLYPLAVHPREPSFDSTSNKVARLSVPYIKTDFRSSLVIAKRFVKKK